MALTLRLKTKEGQHVLKALTSDSTVKELKDEVGAIAKISPKDLRILQGFPPKHVDLTDDSKTLESLNFRTGDTLIVEEDPEAKRHAENMRNEALLQAYESQNEAGGFLTRQTVPANNSCLFTSINYVMENKDKLDLDSAKPMRELIAGIVMSDPEKYTPAFLGRANEAYCEWIMNEASWGGGIEVAILSDYYKKEIAVVDTQNIIVNRFGEDKGYNQRVLLIYDGIHYDPLAFESVDPSERKRTIFSTSNESILRQALELAAEAKSSRQFTDVAKFSVRCLVCNKCLTGQTEAQAHAKETGHQNFGEV